MNEKSERLAEFGICCGTPGCGKTTWILSNLDTLEAQAKEQGRPFRALIFPANRDDDKWHGIPELGGQVVMAGDPERPGKMRPVWKYSEPLNFTGRRVVHLDGSEKKLPAAVDRYAGFRDGVIVVDDVKNAIPSKADLPGWVVAWLSSRRHRMQDIYLAAHSLNDVNVGFLSRGPTLYLWPQTVQVLDAVYGKVPNPERLAQAVAWRNTANLKGPKKWLPLTYGTAPA